MASNHYHVRTGSNSTSNGRDLITAASQLSDAFARLQLHFQAMTQQKDTQAQTVPDYQTPATQYGIVNAADTIDAATAKALYDELNSFIANAKASLEQFCARVRQ